MDPPLNREPQASALRTWLATTVRELVPEYTGTVQDATSLVGDGLGLDSIRLLELIAIIEEHSGVAIAEEDITEAHFGTVGRVLQFMIARAEALP